MYIFTYSPIKETLFKLIFSLVKRYVSAFSVCSGQNINSQIEIAKFEINEGLI